MIWESLDSIVRAVLLKESRSLHWYLPYLSYAAHGLSRLYVTTLKNVTSVKLPVNDYKVAVLPDAYVDYVRVGIEAGEKVRPLVLDTKLNRLYNYDANGAKIPFPSASEVSDSIYSDTVGTTTGDALFGHDLSRDDYGFNVFKERGELQLSPDYPYDYVILDYNSDGLEQAAATVVDPLAKPAIETFIRWQYLAHKRSASPGEIQFAEIAFNKEWKLLRAALNNLTGPDVIHAVRSGYSGTIRN